MAGLRPGVAYLMFSVSEKTNSVTPSRLVTEMSSPWLLRMV
jgi:hypothetical protein